MKPSRPRWLVIWLSIFVFVWAFASWLAMIINPESKMLSWLQAINFATCWCLLIAWNLRGPKNLPKVTVQKPAIVLVVIGTGIAGLVGLVSTLCTLWLGRPGWLPSVLYTLGLPVVAVGFGLVIDRWGGLVESRGNDATT